MCGGTPSILARLYSQQGLSPRVRGEPLSLTQLPRHSQVYPRVCGGTNLNKSLAAEIQGLSPRVRGTIAAALLADSRDGSIPACAGEPLLQTRRTCLAWVYPRVCGGTEYEVKEGESIQGLSPRVRGNLRSRVQDEMRDRSIPACAGEPWFSGRSSVRIAVYPRVCGGTDSLLRTTGAEGGLSPRVRGNHTEAQWSITGHGSIPACAGEPSWCARLRPVQRVYPRVCGGTLRVCAASAYDSGLSPRVRGNQVCGAEVVV